VFLDAEDNAAAAEVVEIIRERADRVQIRSNFTSARSRNPGPSELPLRAGEVIE